MKQLTIILLGLIGIAYGQSNPTSAKTRFVNGLYVGTKLDAYFNSADSNAIYWRADSVVMAKYKGTARALAFSGDLAPYKLIADTFFTGGYTTRARLKQYGDSLGAAKANTSLNNVNGVLSSTYGGAGIINGILKANGSGVVSAAVAGDITTLISGTYVDLTTNQTVAGIKTFSNNVLLTSATDQNIYTIINRVNTAPTFDAATLYRTNGANNWGIGVLGNALGSTTDFALRNLSTNTTTLRANYATNEITLGGALSGTSLSMSGGLTSGNTGGSDGSLTLKRASDGLSVGSFSVIGASSLAKLSTAYTFLTFETESTERARFVANRFLLNTTTDNGTDALQVAGSGLFSGKLEILNSIEGEYFRAGGGTISGRSLTFSNYTISGLAGIGHRINAPNAGANLSLAIAGTDALTIASTGTATFSSSVTASSLIKSGGTSTQALIADGSVQTLTSGTYTPTLTGVSNVSSISAPSSSFELAHYTRIGNIVTVSGTVLVTPTNTATLTEFTISIPISSSYTKNGPVFGASQKAFLSGQVVPTSGNASFVFDSVTNSENRFSYSFSYTVN